MQFVNPKTETLIATYNDITYTSVYYKPAFTITGVAADIHPNWAVGTTYNVGDYVIIPDLKRVYRSTAASNLGFYPPAEVATAEIPKWVDYGNINSYAMFATDENIGGVTTFTDGVLEFDFSKSDTIAGVDLNFTTARVYLMDTEGLVYKSDWVVGTTYALNDAVFYNGLYYVSNVGSNIGNQPDISSQWTLKAFSYYESIDGRDIDCLDFYEYFYTEFAIKTRVILTNLEWFASSVLRIEMDGTSTVGTVALGNIQNMGATLIGTRLRTDSTSRFTTNEFTGYRNIVRYGKTRQLDVSVVYDTKDFDIISQTVDEIIDRNVIWIPTSDDNFSELVTLGYIQQFEITLDGFDKSVSPATIIGVNK